ncbi:hypothetical protein ACWGSE_18975 [Streptomyces diastaticus]
MRRRAGEHRGLDLDRHRRRPLGHQPRAPYDRVITACAVRRVPHAWPRQTRPGGVILTTLGSWPHGAGLAKVTVGADGTAVGRIVRPVSFIQDHAQAQPPVTGDLAARAACADSEREVRVPPPSWTSGLRPYSPSCPSRTRSSSTPVRQRASSGRTRSPRPRVLRRVHFRRDRPQPAELCGSAGPSGSGTRSRRSCSPGGAGSPGIDAVRPGGVTEAAHHYWLDGASAPPLRWEHAMR